MAIYKIGGLTFSSRATRTVLSLLLAVGFISSLSTFAASQSHDKTQSKAPVVSPTASPQVR